MRTTSAVIYDVSVYPSWPVSVGREISRWSFGPGIFSGKSHQIDSIVDIILYLRIRSLIESVNAVPDSSPRMEPAAGVPRSSPAG